MKKTGIKWGDQPVPDDVYEVIKKAGDDYTLIADWAAQIALSRSGGIMAAVKREFDFLAMSHFDSNSVPWSDLHVTMDKIIALIGEQREFNEQEAHAYRSFIDEAYGEQETRRTP